MKSDLVKTLVRFRGLQVSLSKWYLFSSYFASGFQWWKSLSVLWRTPGLVCSLPTHPKRGLSGSLINGTLSAIGIVYDDTSFVHLTPGLIQRCKAAHPKQVRFGSFIRATLSCSGLGSAETLFSHPLALPPAASAFHPPEADMLLTNAASQALNTY